MAIHYRDIDTEPRTYSNGVVFIDGGMHLVTGTSNSADLRMDDGFYAIECGFIDAPKWIAAGSTVFFDCWPPRATVPNIAYRGT